ncbi:hypothetical protein E3Q19_02816 [Wallemia mellicola]|nr:hypothetical protein E3Q19_02816 [Wallemia mellicola]TIC26969.1 hypothetical protein E3Q11_02864 [Wallemia mellicola]TIC73700.1 hypothetical protein E3Q00_02678 [Wallemia mellicola]
MTPPPAKRQKPEIEFSDGLDFITKFSTAYRTSSYEGHSIKDLLTAFRNAISVPQDLPLSDKRYRLVLDYLKRSSNASELFRAWELCHQDKNLASTLPLPISAIAALLNVAASHTHLHPSALAILNEAIKSQHFLRDYMSETKNDLILAALKLTLAMAEAAGRIGVQREMRTIWENFGWNYKFVPKLLNMRRKKSSEADNDPIGKADIRTLYLLLNLVFISPSLSNPYLINAHLSQKETNQQLFRGLLHDHYLVIQKFLQVWHDVWSDGRVSRSTKLFVWNEQTIDHLLKLYNRVDDESSDDHEFIPAKLVHAYLKSLCTKPGFALCFKDDGYYPRSKQQPSDNVMTERLYNRQLLGVLKNLRIGDSELHADLALSILSACPELSSHYWKQSSLTLEPRLSSRWISNISYLACAVSLPVPSDTFKHNDSFKSTPPPLNNMIESILPTIIQKANFTKAFYASPPIELVQHCIALALSKALDKLDRVQKLMLEAAISLEENENDGQWYKRRRELLREAMKRLPEGKAIAHFAASQESSKNKMLSENSLRLLYQYQSIIPPAFQEAQIDISKLLFSGGLANPDLSSFDALSQLHALRLLKGSDVYNVASKVGSESAFKAIMKLHINTKHAFIRDVTSEIVSNFLSNSVLFEHDKTETQLWLSNLTLDSLDFIDGCILRCVKTPYRYLEQIRSMLDSNVDIDIPALVPSPLVFTLLEQLNYQVSKKLLSDDNASELAAYVRNLIIGLAGKQPSIKGIIKNLFEWLQRICDNHDGVNTRNQSSLIKHQIKGLTKSLKKVAGLNGLERSDLPTRIYSLDPVSQNVFASLQFDGSESVTNRFDLLVPHITQESLENPVSRDYIKESALSYYSHARSAQFLIHRLGDESGKAAFVGLLVELIKFARKDEKRAVIETTLQSEELLTIFNGKDIDANLSRSLRNFTSELRKLEYVSSDYSSQLSNFVVQAVTQFAGKDWKSYENVMLSWIPFFNYKQLEEALVISSSNIPESSATLTQVLKILSEGQHSESVATICENSKLLPALIDVVFRTTDEEVLDQLYVFFERLLPLRSFKKGNAKVADVQFKSVLKPIEIDVKKISLPQSPKQDAIIALLITRFPQYRRAFYKSAKKVDAGDIPILSATTYANIIALGVRLDGSIKDDEIDLAKKVAGNAIQHAINGVEEISIEHTLALLQSSEYVSALLSHLNWVPGSSAQSCKVLSQIAKWACKYDDAKDFIRSAFLENVGKLLRVVDKQEEEVSEVALERLTEVAYKISLTADDLESFLITTSQRGLGQAHVMKFATTLLKLVDIPPHLCLSLLQQVYGSDLFKDASEKLDVTKQRLVEYIHTLFFKAPVALCQLAQINPLVNIYNATLHRSDTLILDIFNLFERVCRQSLIAITRVWVPPSTISAANSGNRTIDAIVALDSNKIFNTCLNFPNRLSFSDVISNVDDVEHKEDLYDPRFLMALLSSVFRDETLTDFEYLELVRCSIINIPIVGLSSRRPDIRKVSLHLMGHVSAWLNKHNFTEKQELEYLLQNFRNTIPPHEMHEEVPRSSTLITVFVAHATRAIVNPTTHAYPLIMRFLLQRPYMDVKNVPLFFDLLLSYNEDRKWERGWILRFVRDAVKSSDDWRMMKRRHNWDVLATLYESSNDDSSIRTLIEEIALTLTTNPSTATNLVCSKPILMWINQQFAITKLGNKSLQNFLNVALQILKNGDINAIDHATRGVWRSEVLSIANLSTKYANITCLKLSSEIIWRLSRLDKLDRYPDTITPVSFNVVLQNLITSVSNADYEADEMYKETLKYLGLVYSSVPATSDNIKNGWIQLTSRLLATGDEEYYNMVLGQLHGFL